MFSYFFLGALRAASDSVIQNTQKAGMPISSSVSGVTLHAQNNRKGKSAAASVPRLPNLAIAL